WQPHALAHAERSQRLQRAGAAGARLGGHGHMSGIKKEATEHEPEQKGAQERMKERIAARAAKAEPDDDAPPPDDPEPDDKGEPAQAKDDDPQQPRQPN